MQQDDDEVIDTTDPQFAGRFAGFTGTPGMAAQQRKVPMNNTEIKFG